MSPRRRAAVLIAAALAVPSARARASDAPAAGEGETPWDAVWEDARASADAGELALSDEDAALLKRQERVGALMERGRAHLDAGELHEAISRWREAYALVPEPPGFAHQRAVIVLAIVGVYERLHERDGELGPLRAASGLIDDYLGDVAPSDVENRATVEAARRRVAAQLREAEAQARALRSNRGGQRGKARDDAATRSPRSRRLLIAGGVTMGAGVLAGLGLMGLGVGLGSAADRKGAEIDVNASLELAERDALLREQFDAGVRANRLAIAGGVIAGLAFATGVSLILVSAAPRVRALSLSPPARGRGLVLSLRGRF
ncbi:MAG: hypothetical protein KC636_27915 [Myxococcales bacterium]|nr:hypothetical protein [Myxococcales bacterium]